MPCLFDYYAAERHLRYAADALMPPMPLFRHTAYAADAPFRHGSPSPTPLRADTPPAVLPLRLFCR